jgi:non-ribosomal peptide synthetase-like protein
LWTNFVWRLEFVNALYEFFAAPLILDLLQGTPFLAWYLRMMGAKIGKACYLDTTGFLEWDLVSVGDRVVINENVIMQTHLFEDRVLKASHLKVGNDCTIGTTSVVLYDSEMKDGSHLDDLSLLMKGEVLPEQTKWIGIPAIEAGAVHARQANGKLRLARQPYQHESAAG